MILCACTALIPRATPASSATISCTGGAAPPRAITSRSERRASAMTTHGCGSETTPYSWTTFGWRMRESARTSRRTNSEALGAGRPAGGCLIATSSPCHRPRSTSACPPPPMWSPRSRSTSRSSHARSSSMAERVSAGVDLAPPGVTPGAGAGAEIKRERGAAVLAGTVNQSGFLAAASFRARSSSFCRARASSACSLRERSSRACSRSRVYASRARLYNLSSSSIWSVISAMCLFTLSACRSQPFLPKAATAERTSSSSRCNSRIRSSTLARLVTSMRFTF
mmetsp:Transcript_39387/g.130394  ORF Transcript_39387/g.130394 Transcript_39387/m.130394 type:complete len:282 (-) Transcript_39387:227-1072(-)